MAATLAQRQMATKLRRAWRPLRHADDYALEIPDLGSVKIPKYPVANIAWRRTLTNTTDPEEQEVLWHACAASPIFWFNTFAWTYVVQQIDADGSQHAIAGQGGSNVPFVSWPCQDEAIRFLVDAINDGQDAMIDKSREMGASWLVLAVFHWFWLFKEDVHFLEMSRTEKLVDELDNPDSLFWKHDYINSWLPSWMIGPQEIKRHRLRLVNITMKSTILGESTTGDVGQGGRKTAALIDEAARIRELKHVMSALADTTSCRIPNSTPSGPSFFSELRFGGKVKVCVLPWWDHPDKGVGRKVVVHRPTGKAKIVSPWYLKQVAKRVSKLEIAENLDIDHQAAGFVFFDVEAINRQLTTYAQVPPTYSGDLIFQTRTIYDDLPTEIRLRKIGKIRFRAMPGGGKWRLWTELEKDRNGRLRPPQDRNYVFGMDVSAGVGASNSVISVFDAQARWKVGEWASGALDPAEFARAAAMAGLWWGGDRGFAFAAWEANGPGNSFGREMMRLKYPWFYRQRRMDRKRQEPTEKLGWWTSDQSKIDLLTDYRGALSQDKFRNPSPEALTEASSYIWYEKHGSGMAGIGPATLQNEGADAQKTHGDRVIADAIAWHAQQWAMRMSPPDRVAPVGSVAERRDRSKARAKKKRASVR